MKRRIFRFPVLAILTITWFYFWCACVLFGQVIPRPGGGVMWGHFPLASAAAFSPTDLTGLVFRVSSTNLPLNSTINSWTDSIGGVVLTQAVASLRPTNASVGLWFSNSQNFIFPVWVKTTTTNPMMVVISPFSPPNAPNIYGDILAGNSGGGSCGLYLYQAANITFTLNPYGSTEQHWFAGPNGSIGTNLVTVFVNGGLTPLGLETYYTNGIPNATNTPTVYTFPFNIMGADWVGGKYQGYIMEIGIWSNRPTFTSVQVSNLYHYATNTYHF